MVLRRNTAYNVSAFPPSIDFAGAESFAPVLHGFTLSNLAGDRSSVSESFLSTNGSSETFFESIGSFNAASATDFVPFYTLPDSLLAADDFHSLFIAAEPQGGNTNSGRFAILLLHTSASQIAGSVTFGPKLTTPTVTSLGATPNVRMRVQLPLQTAYSAAASAGFSQGDNIVVNVTVTAGYSSGAPATWTLDVPDLSSAGYDAAWGLKNDSPVTWNVVGLGGSVLPLLGASPVDGMVAVAGIVFSPSASTQLGRWRRAGLPVYRLTLPR
jgi:hypothetical protein